MPLVIRCGTWQALLQEKEDKGKKTTCQTRKKGGQEKRKKEVKMDIAGKSSFEETSD